MSSVAFQATIRDRFPSWARFPHVLLGLLLAASGCGDNEENGPATPGDATPPSAVADLAASFPSASGLVLTWSAPGDDGTAGKASSYDLRYSTESITDSNWVSASPAGSGPAPKPSGQVQSHFVAVPSDTTKYYFALKSTDDASNSSALSNVASAWTLAGDDSIPPERVTDLSANATSPTTVTLTWTAPGDDRMLGTAAAYDVRYATSQTLPWDDATQVTVALTPRPAGQPETFAVSGLPPTAQLWFRIRTSDEVPNWSEPSNIAPYVTTDVYPPGTIRDLTAVHVGASRVLLVWTAVGDDGCAGVATAYDIRFSASPVTESTWSEATVVHETPIPRGCGERESLAVDLPDEVAGYWIAMRVVDEQGNNSPVSNLASLDDSHWNAEIAPDQPFYGHITSVANYAGGIVIAGFFTTLDGVEVNDVAIRTGGAWEPMASGMGGPSSPDLFAPAILSMTTHLGAIVVGGLEYLHGYHGNQFRYPRFSRWDGTGWQQLQAFYGLFSQVRVVFASDENLCFAGEYSIGMDPEAVEYVEYVARSTDEAPEILGEFDAPVRAIAVHDGALIVGGGFTRVDDLPVNHIAMWDGKSWTGMAGGMDGDVYNLLSDGGRLIAGGIFRTAGGMPAERVAEWTGGSWAPLGSGLGVPPDDFVAALSFHDGELIAAGRISEFESRGIRNIARWDGGEWRGLGSGTQGHITDVMSHDGVLFVVGAFDSAGGRPANRIATWEK